MTKSIYFEGPFDKWHAFTDLCLMADEKGTVETSLKALKNRWSWTSIKKVRNYLGTISELDLVTVKGIPKKGMEIHINQGVQGSAKTKKGTDKGTDKGTISADKEVLYKEVEGTKSPSNSTSTLEEYRKMMEEFDDE